MTAPRLSKTRYISGCQCHLKLWYDCHETEFETEIDPVTQAIFDTGHAIGRLARTRYPGGVLVEADHLHAEQAVAETRALLADESVPAIFEAAFEHRGVLVRVDILERNPGGQIIYDVKCTRFLDSVIREHGGDPLMWKTGHSFIKAKIKETGALLAGEMSGHIFINERWYGFDDGIYAAARLLEILAKDERNSQEIFDALPDSVNTPELNVAMREGEPPVFIGQLLENAHFEDASISTIDGLRAEFSDGWGLVRASNTTPVLVLRFEADNDAALQRIMGEFRRVMLQVDAGLKLPF